MVLPIFIISVLMLISIIPIFAVCENVTFSVVDEMYFETIKSGFRKNPVTLPIAVKHRIVTENPKVTSYKTTGYRYLYKNRAAGIDDLITLDFRTVVSEHNPFGLFSSVGFDGSVTARAFTGKLFEEPPVEQEKEDEKDKTVYVFPEWGTCYHSKDCTYVKSSCEMVYLTDEIVHAFRPCELCHASHSAAGSPVFCFRSSGQVYHVSGCRIVDRYYVEMKKSVCEAKGYRPCSKCGGG